jgi:hypothetical protein
MLAFVTNFLSATCFVRGSNGWNHWACDLLWCYCWEFVADFPAVRPVISLSSDSVRSTWLEGKGFAADADVKQAVTPYI